MSRYACELRGVGALSCQGLQHCFIPHLKCSNTLAQLQVLTFPLFLRTFPLSFLFLLNGDNLRL